MRVLPLRGKVVVALLSKRTVTSLCGQAWHCLPFLAGVGLSHTTQHRGIPHSTRSMNATRASEALQQGSHHELGLPPPGQVAGINRLAEGAHSHPGLAHRPLLSLQSIEGSIRPTCSDCSEDRERGQGGDAPHFFAVYGLLTPLPRSTREVL